MQPNRTDLLALLRSPLDGGPLKWLDERPLAQLNAKLSDDKVFNVEGEQLREPIEAALFDEPNQCIWPVFGGIADLRKEGRIDLEQE